MSKTRYLSKLTNGKGETLIVWDPGKTGGYNYEVTKADKKHTPFKKYTDTSIEDVYKDLKKMGYKKMNESITKAELKSIIRETLVENNIILEAKVPTSSLYGIIGKHLWSDFLGIVKKQTKGLKWVDNRAISMSIWMATFEGYTTSDVAFDGTLSLYTITQNEFEVRLSWNDAGKGGNDKTWTIAYYEDYSKYAKEIGKFISTWMKV